MSDRTTLYALAAHAIGDFVTQTDWMANRKLESSVARAVHVAVYTTTFVPVALSASWSRRQTVVFLGTIATTHFVIDSRRWSSAIPIWRDQALHLVSLALAAALADWVGDRDR